MIIKEKAGSLKEIDLAGRQLETITIEWHETNKRILHKQTDFGTSVVLKFLQQSPALMDGDVLYADDKKVIAVTIASCEAIVLVPANRDQACALCYEIGNKHLPLFLNGNELLMPYDAPVYIMLQAMGMEVTVAQRKLDMPLKTSVLPHGHPSSGETLFTRILKLTTKA